MSDKKYTHIIIRDCLYKGRRCRFDGEANLPMYNGYKVFVDMGHEEIEYRLWPNDVEKITT